MTSDRDSQISDLFHAALDRDPASRADFLDHACQGDQRLKGEVERLLAAHATADSFLETPVAAVIDGRRLTPGARLGAYRINGFVGAGGMGEVYRAHDSRLGREVAIKVLPPEAAVDADRRARFAREAQAIAALNHPNIVTIHSVEQSGDVHFLTMELVDGKTLAQLIPRGGLPIDRLLEIAIVLADAIGTAHGQNVIHRDVKPANVMVTSDGRVKLLDFGIAKLTAPAAIGELGTATRPASTADGRVMGTVDYMSPEQAEGHDVDHRSDIFSLGVVLYELATGQRPFTGESSASVLSAILKDVPAPVTELKPELPQSLGRLIRRCLAKDPNRRYQSAIDLRNELEEIREDLKSSASPVSGRQTVAVGHSPFSRTAQFLIGVGLLGATAGAVYLAWFRPVQRSPTQILRTTLAPPFDVRVAPQNAPLILAISPDGRWVAFHGVADDSSRSGLYLRDTSTLKARYISEGRGSSPFFSPDSRWLAYWSDGVIWKTLVDDGRREPICDAPAELRGASWGDDDTIAFTQGATSSEAKALRRCPATSGTPVVITTGSDSTGYLFPQILPRSRAALVMLLPAKEIAVVSLQTGEVVRKWFRGATPRYVQGYLVFRRIDQLYAAPFDLDRLDVTREPQPVLDGIAYNSGGSETSAFDISRTGALVYITSSTPIADAQLIWLDRQGQSGPPVGDRRNYRFPSLDPTGRRVAVHVGATGGSDVDFDLWVFDVSTGRSTRLTTGQMTNNQIVWSPDGKWIVFSSQKSGLPALYRVRTDGGGLEQLTKATPDEGIYDHPTSLQNNILMFERQVGADDFDLLTMSIDPVGPPKAFLKIDGVTTDGQLSPDARWVAYTSREAGEQEVFVRSFQDPMGGRVLVASGSSRPRWAEHGRRLLYLKDGAIVTVPVTSSSTATEFTFGKPEVAVGRQPSGSGVDLSTLQMSPDGARFLVVKRPPPTGERQLVYVQHWLDEMKDRLLHPR